MTPNLLVVHPAFAARSARELVALAKQKPGAVTFGTGGIGSSSHLAVELFRNLSGVTFNHVPYKGAGPALTDVIAGQIDFMIATMPGAVQHVRSGRLRAIGISTLKRSPGLPEVPTIAESGLPEYETITWYGLMGPKGLPRAIVARWQSALGEAVKSREMKDRLDLDGLEVPEIGSAYLLNTIQRDIVKWTRVVKAGNLKLGN